MIVMVLAAGAITYFSRFVLLVFGGQPGAALARYLRLVPVAIFAALIVPGLAAPDGEIALSPELAAGAAGLVTAAATRNVFVTLGAGYIVFATLRWVI